MILNILLIALIGWIVWTAYQHDWDWKATTAAVIAAVTGLLHWFGGLIGLGGQ